MMRRHEISQGAWERLEDLLPGRAGDVGVTAADNRLFVNAVYWTRRREPLGETCLLGLVGGTPFFNASTIGRRKASGSGWPVKKGAEAQQRKGRNKPRDYDQHLYKQRNLLERFIGWAKHFRRDATRYEKTARNFLAVWNFVAIIKLLK